MNLNTDLAILGIDISKRTFDIWLIHNGKDKRKKFDNNANGFKQLGEFLGKNNVVKVHACMEATGRYYEALAQYLFKEKHLVSVVNPLKIKGYAISELQRSKTDELDAGVIARFCRANCPPPWKPQPQEISDLQQAERYLESLKTNRRQELNRLESGITCTAIKSMIEKHVEELDLKIKEVENWLKQHVKKYEKLNQHYELIVSIIGIGNVTAFTYLGEFGYTENFHHTRQAESFCGLTVRKYESGSSILKKSRTSKVGNWYMRKALYMPALSAIQYNPIIRKFAEHLKKVGKPPKVIIGAVMRKLFRIIYAVVKSERPFDINYQAKLEPAQIPI
jgi:transposase